MTNEEMRKESGSFTSSDKLMCFMYLLMRNELPTGKVEELVTEIENSIDNNNNDDGSYKFEFANGWLAKYAQNLSSRIKK